MRNLQNILLDLGKFSELDNADKKPEVLDAIADLFFATHESHGAAELEFFGVALERIAFNLSAEERAKLASRMADIHKAPKSLVRKLAEDEVSVARPILEQSPCLNEDDLIELASSLDQGHLRAIAHRETLSCEITEIIVVRGDDDVLECVIRNKGARFSRDSLAKLVDSAGRNRTLFSALEQRNDVPDVLVDQARDSIAELNASELREIAKNRRPRSKKVKEHMLADFARANMLAEAIRCLSLITGHPEIFVKQCFLQTSLTVLAQLCKANGFDTATYAALLRLRFIVGGPQGQTVADAMRKYRTLGRREAQRALGYEEAE